MIPCPPSGRLLPEEVSANTTNRNTNGNVCLQEKQMKIKPEISIIIQTKDSLKQHKAKATVSLMQGDNANSFQNGRACSFW